MTGPAIQPAFPPPTTPVSHSRAQFLPDINVTTDPITTPIGGVLLYSEAGVLKALLPSGVTIVLGSTALDVFDYNAGTLDVGVAAFPVTTMRVGQGATMAAPPVRLVTFTDALGVDNAAGVITMRAARATGASRTGGLAFQIGVPHGTDAVLQTATTGLQIIPPPGSAFANAPLVNVAGGPGGAGYFYVGNFLGITIPGDLGPGIVATIGDTTDSGAYRAILYHGTATFGAGLLTRRAKGSVAVPAVVVLNDVIGTFLAAGYDANAATGNFSGNVGGLRILAAETFAAATHGTKLAFSTTLIGASARRDVVEIQDTGDLANILVGAGFRVKEGANAKSGVAVLVAGTVTIATTKATATMRVDYARQAAGGVIGNLAIANVVAGVSFDIVSDVITDTSTVWWQIWEPA